MTDGEVLGTDRNGGPVRAGVVVEADDGERIECFERAGWET